MTRFIQTQSGAFVPVSDIVSINPDPEDPIDKNCTISVRRGRRIVAMDVIGSAREIADIINRTVIPAEPGYFLLPTWVGSATIEQFRKMRTPVIAWAFDDQGTMPTPITVDGPWDYSAPDETLVMTPYGMIIHQNLAVYSNLSEAYEDMKSEEAVKRAKLRRVAGARAMSVRND